MTMLGYLIAGFILGNFAVRVERRLWQYRRRRRLSVVREVSKAEVWEAWRWN